MKKIIPFLIIILLSGLWIWIGVESAPKFVNILCYYENYNLVHTKDTKRKLEIELYLSSNKSYYSKKDNIVESYLESEGNIISIELIDIIELETVSINRDKYYKYSYVFEIQNSSNEIIKLENVQLVLNYDMINPVKVTIGSLVLGDIPYSHDQNNIINLLSMEGVVNKVNGVNSLTGIIIKINPKGLVTLKRMELFEIKAFVCGEEVKVIESYNQNSSMNELLGYDYDYINGNDKDINQDISCETTILFPIKNSQGLNKLSFKIDFLYMGNDYTFYYDSFVFFEDVSKDNMEYKQYTYAFY